MSTIGGPFLMFHVTTTKSNHALPTIEEMAEWLAGQLEREEASRQALGTSWDDRKPTAIRISWGEIETEFMHCGRRGTLAVEMRYALRKEEARRLGISPGPGGFRLSADGVEPPTFVRVDFGSSVIAKGPWSRHIGDNETLADLVGKARS